MIDIRQLSLPEHGLDDLATQARIEGFNFVDRLQEEWAAGKNQFDLPGESFFGAYDDDRLVGIGGLNRDPYQDDSRVGRVRRFYVLPHYRRRGVGKLLLATIVTEARRSFDQLRLRTSNPGASRFYEACGFEREEGEAMTHILQF